MKSEKKSWVVKVECVVMKEVITRECTEEEATDNPFESAQDEREIGQSDWTVVSVEPND